MILIFLLRCQKHRIKQQNYAESFSLRYAPNCKFIFTVDEKANAETAKKVVECKKTGMIDCFIYNTISSSYMTAVLDSL